MTEVYFEAQNAPTSSCVVTFNGPTGDGWSSPTFSTTDHAITGRWIREKPADKTKKADKPKK